MPGAQQNSGNSGTGRGARSGDRLVTALLFGASAASVLCVAAIFGFLAYFSLPLFTEHQLGAVLSWHWRPTSGEFGILPMLVGSLLLASSAMLLAYPLGLGLCCFVHGLGPTWVARPLMGLVRLMTSVPTVVYGLVSVFLLVPLIRAGFSGSGFSWLAAVLTLAVLVLPTIVLVIDSQLRLAGPELHLTAAALGLTRVQELLHLTLPLSARGLKAAAVLGFGRAIGDTLLPLMLAGNAPQVPHTPLEPLRTLTAHIALVVATDSQSAAYNSLFACGLILFLVSLAVNLGLKRIRAERPSLGRHA
jgi:phosphate transport system permease protein